jgi:sterol 3beta-glucosyltransferase
MKVLILAHGTRGDVQPYAALAVALEQAGHRAVLAAPAASVSLVAPYGLQFQPVHDGPNTLLDDPSIREAIETNYRGLRGKTIAMQVMRRSKPLMARVFADMVAAARGGADLIVHAPGIPGHRLAEAIDAPAVPALLQPVWVPTAAFPNPMLPLPVPRTLNRASYLSTALMLRTFGSIADTALDLPRRARRHDILSRPDGRPATVLQGFTRHLLPPGSDYPPWVRTTGFWFLPAPATWTPPAELTDFLQAGEPPVYIGFGSMAGTDPQRMGKIVTEAVRLARVRAVLVTGWGGIHLDHSPDHVLQVTDAPHDWLFPRTAAIVHHGGSGTTGAALAAGRPQVICPFVADQPFWATRAHAAGVAAPPQPQHRLTPEGLAGAIRQAVTDARIARRAEEISTAVRAEDGARTAVGVVESANRRR